MRNLLRKECALGASPLTFWFIPFGLTFFLPGYPVLCGVFFVTLGIFQSFQNARETNDILFSALLPVAKRDVVRGKFLFVCGVECCALIIMAAAVAVRMTVLSDVAAYRENALMNGNLFALGAAFFLFGLFNRVFVGGFFKTAYATGRPFLLYCILCFVVIGVAEAAHYFPYLGALNAFGTAHIAWQLLSLFCGILLFLTMTAVAGKKSCRRFETIDL